MRKQDELTPSLFDEPTEEQIEDEEEFEEMSHGYFLAASRRTQLDYCWRRDLDSAVRAESQTDAAFFLDRAAYYKTELEQL